MHTGMHTKRSSGSTYTQSMYKSIRYMYMYTYNVQLHSALQVSMKLGPEDV